MQRIKKSAGFATIELPFVLLAFVAIVGLVVGGYLWYRSGELTTGAWIGFALVIPFLLLSSAIVVTWLVAERRQKRNKNKT